MQPESSKDDFSTSPRLIDIICKNINTSKKSTDDSSTSPRLIDTICKNINTSKKSTDDSSTSSRLIDMIYKNIDTSKKTNDVIIFYNGCYLITHCECYIEDYNDKIQMDIIINFLFTRGCVFEEFKMSQLPIIENAVAKLKNVNYGVKIVDEDGRRNKCYNLLSLIIEVCIFEYMLGRSPNTLSLSQAESLLRISKNLIDKNLDYKYMTGRGFTIVGWCKYERDYYEHSSHDIFCFYYYDEIFKYMNLQDEKKLNHLISAELCI